MLGFAATIAAIVVALDRATKLWLMRLPDPEPFSFSWLITRTYHQNHGSIANFPVPQWIILAITFLVLPLIGYGFFQSMHQHRRREALALSLVIGGAIGNLWDRLAWGYVFDWILIFQLSVLNLADIAIGAGMVWYLIERGRQDIHE